MNNIIISHMGPNLFDQDITAAESLLQMPIPDGLRCFLKSSNGGKPADVNDTYCVPSSYLSFRGEYGVDDRDAELSVQRFYKLDEIVEQYLFIRKIRPDFPQYLLPIGFDSCGNTICVDACKRPGSVWFWDHEVGVHGSPFEVAPSMCFFLERLGLGTE